MFLLIALSLFLGQLLILGSSIDKSNSSYQIYYHSTSPNKVVERFGLLGYFRIDLRGQLFKKKIILQPLTEDLIVNIKPEIEYNLIDIDFEKLIQEESDESLINMHKYFKSVAPTEKNRMTGKFKGYNVIQITAEGFSHYAVDEKVTPTLYKLTNAGLVFNNFYNPVWNVSTSDGEYAHMTGLIPKNGVWSMREVAKNYMPFVLPKQLAPLGYKTMAYHNHTYTYYDRHKTYPSFGYTYKGLGSGLDVKPTWPESDLEMMQLSINDYIDDDLFHTYYMTVSGHMRYTFSDNYIASKNRDLVKDLDLTKNAKAYMATQIELDLALEYLILQLEAKGLMDKTLIVMSADHYPYGLETEDLESLAGHQVEKTFELYKSSLIIYSEGIDKLVVDKPVASLDVLATISNMLGLQYDSRLLIGQDIFANKPALVIFNDQSFITDKGMYDASKQKFTAFKNTSVSDNYINQKIREVKEKFYYSVLILEKDYYKYVID